MNLTVSFSWAGLVIFALPMLINIAYVLFPPAEKTEQAAVTRWVEAVEQVSRMAYLLAVVLLVSRRPLALHSVWLYLAAGFLVLYYLCAAVWLHNYPAVLLMIIFGAAHITVSLQSFQKG